MVNTHTLALNLQVDSRIYIKNSRFCNGLSITKLIKLQISYCMISYEIKWLHKPSGFIKSPSYKVSGIEEFTLLQFVLVIPTYSLQVLEYHRGLMLNLYPWAIIDENIICAVSHISSYIMKQPHYYVSISRQKIARKQQFSWVVIHFQHAIFPLSNINIVSSSSLRIGTLRPH